MDRNVYKSNSLANTSSQAVLDKSMFGSEAGLKDNSLLVVKENVDDVEIDLSMQRNTVDQFLNEEPPTLQHN